MNRTARSVFVFVATTAGRGIGCVGHVLGFDDLDDVQLDVVRAQVREHALGSDPSSALMSSGACGCTAHDGERAARLRRLLAGPELGRYLPAALDVVALRGNRIEHIIAFRSPEPFTRFGLPDCVKT
jgi:hypothetical protein